ncbi:AAA family ATPase [Paenibacillus polymyxa]|uniref:AAA family ATPase n=1 Tax=Paenibacillus TaxID=44249 RepID=UPI00142E33E5|nr:MULTISPECIES: adenylate kinase [Paenibacillus]KAF6658891.1 adenylate kinase [Paenibacillus sp. EKM301P]UBS85424.1 adenylate kinase [Paenibacillus polymyxa]WHX33943.1 adenylate kinase [Paenibacillus polymyxa]
MTTLPHIGLIGKLRSGKSEVGNYLSDNYGYTQFAFGDELKRYAHELFGEPAPDEKPRELYQWFGQTMRERDPDIWVRKCFEAIERDRDSIPEDLRRAHEFILNGDVIHSVPARPFRAVVGDCRQPNEYAALKSAGYVLIRVEAPDAVRIDRAIKSGDVFNYADLFHGTETALDGYLPDFTVTNDGTLDRLHAQIDEIIAYLSGEWPE